MGLTNMLDIKLSRGDEVIIKEVRVDLRKPKDLTCVLKLMRFISLNKRVRGLKNRISVKNWEKVMKVLLKILKKKKIFGKSLLKELTDLPDWWSVDYDKEGEDMTINKAVFWITSKDGKFCLAKFDNDIEYSMRFLVVLEIKKRLK